MKIYQMLRYSHHSRRDSVFLDERHRNHMRKDIRFRLHKYEWRAWNEIRNTMTMPKQLRRTMLRSNSINRTNQFSESASHDTCKKWEWDIMRASVGYLKRLHYDKTSLSHISYNLISESWSKKISSSCDTCENNEPTSLEILLKTILNISIHDVLYRYTVESLSRFIWIHEPKTINVIEPIQCGAYHMVSNHNLSY